MAINTVYFDVPNELIDAVSRATGCPPERLRYPRDGSLNCVCIDGTRAALGELEAISRAAHISVIIRENKTIDIKIFELALGLNSPAHFETLIAHSSGWIERGKGVPEVLTLLEETHR